MEDRFFIYLRAFLGIDFLLLVAIVFLILDLFCLILKK